MVFTGEGSRVGGSEGIGGVQRSDPGGRCWDLRGSAEEFKVAKLYAGTIQREAGKGRTCFSSNVRGDDVGRLKSRSDPLGLPTTFRVRNRPYCSRAIKTSLCRRRSDAAAAVSASRRLPKYFPNLAGDDHARMRTSYYFLSHRCNVRNKCACFCPDTVTRFREHCNNAFGLVSVHGHCPWPFCAGISVPVPVP